MWLIDQLELSDNPVVLDLGCGSGRHIKQIKKRHPGATVIGVDLNPGQDIIVSSFEEYVPDRTFETIFSSYALYYAENMIELIERLLGYTRMMFVCGPAKGTNQELADIGIIPPVPDFISAEEIAQLEARCSSLEQVRLDNTVLFTEGSFESWWHNHNAYDPNVEFIRPLSMSKKTLGIRMHA